MTKQAILIFLLWPLMVLGQYSPEPIVRVNAAPSGSCSTTQVRYLTTTGTFYGCVSGTWTTVGGGGGSGTVTSVSASGGLLSVANPTTTPAISVAGTSGGIPYFSGAAAWASSAALTANGILKGGGAGTAPSASGCTIDSSNNLSCPGSVTSGTTGTTGAIDLSGATSGTVTIQPAAVAGTWSLTLPASAGTSNQVLTTDGSGTGSWSGPFAPTASPTFTGTVTTPITGSTQCLHVNTSGVLSGTGSDCGSGGGGGSVTSIATSSPISGGTITTTGTISCPTCAVTGANTFTGAQTISTNGAASTPSLIQTGTWFTGGSATTTKPQHLIEPTGATSTAWSTNGTGLGVNAPSGFTGNVVDFQSNGASKFSVTSTGNIHGAGGNVYIADSMSVSGGGLTVSGGNIETGGASILGFTSSSRIWAPSNNNLRVSNNAGTDFSLLMFGGTTSSFPALKRSTTSLQARLADDSSYAAFAANTVQSATVYTVATLPTCNGGAEGTRAAVSDLLTPTFLGAAVGGGAVHGGVYCNGTTWVTD